jgi:hypothetical protein
MNAREGLERIRERLEENGARAETLKLVDTMVVRASAPGSERAQASLSQLVRLLIRTPVANADVGVYDDLTRLEAELHDAAALRAAEREAEANRPLPKSKKFYKQQREREERERAKRG